MRHVNLNCQALCPARGARFIPRCELHYHLYFEILAVATNRTAVAFATRFYRGQIMPARLWLFGRLLAGQPVHNQPCDVPMQERLPLSGRGSVVRAS